MKMLFAGLALVAAPVAVSAQSEERIFSPRSEWLLPILSPYLIPSDTRPICAHGQVTGGTDVAIYDEGVNWQMVAEKRSFAFIKATEGETYKNPRFSRDWRETRDAGIMRGSYHYFHPGDSPVTQANFFLNVVGDLEYDDLPMVLDWEVSDGVSAVVQIANAKKFLKLIEDATGKTPIIYISPSYFSKLGSPPGFERYPLFIANYGVSCPHVPTRWTNWVFWQWGEGPVFGIPGKKADVDVFNGSPTVLSQFATTRSPSP